MVRRILPCGRLRVNDVDCASQHITGRDGTSAHDRVTMLPQLLQPPRQQHLVTVQLLHEDDLHEGYGDVYVPYAFARQDPNAGTAWRWQDVFPASKRSIGSTRGYRASAS